MSKPILYADGVRNDAPALQAFLNGQDIDFATDLAFIDEHGNLVFSGRLNLLASVSGGYITTITSASSLPCGARYET